MKNLNQTLSIFLIILLPLIHSCSLTDDQIIEQPTTVSIKVDDIELDADSKYLLLLCDNDNISNSIRVKNNGAQVALKFPKKAKELGLIDTFYFKKGADEIELEIKEGNYFVQIYNKTLNKTFSSITFEDEDVSYVLPGTIATGNLFIQVAQSSILGTEIDSAIVKVFDRIQANFMAIDSVPFDSLTKPTQFETITLDYRRHIYWYDGLGIFYNIPTGNYYATAHDRGKVFLGYYKFEYNFREVEVIKDSTTFYRLVFAD